MYNSHLENQLLMPDVADALQNYVSIQIDIDDTKIKAAAYAAQRIDIQRVIGQENLNQMYRTEQRFG